MFEQIFILPLEYIAKIVYLKIYSLTLNYGASLFFLSLISNIIMTLLIQLVSNFSERESKLQAIIAPQIKKIKLESKSEERHRRITNLYKRYSYHPVLSLRSALPVLIQLPFLFAAYIMLSNLEEIRGISFFIIKDIGKPDAIFNGINILPIVMTAANIATAYISKNFSFKEKLQANIIAIFFLILLYNAQSALILFWTMNNLLSLLRNTIKRFFPIPVLNLANIKKKFIYTLKNTAFYPVLLGIYPALFLYSHNIDQSAINDAIYPILISLLISIIILAGLKKIFQILSTAALYATLLTVFIFYYGFFYFAFTYIKDSPIISFIIWFIIFSTVIFLLLKFGMKKNVSESLILPLNILTLTIISILVLQVSFYSIDTRSVSNIQNEEIQDNKDTNNSQIISELPDIYYIILDGYAGNWALKTYFNYDNSKFTEKLKEYGFYVADSSNSNYGTTFLSLASSLNMDYVQNMKINLDKTSNDRREIYNKIKYNEAVKVLKNKGYKYIHFQTGWGATKKNEVADIDYSSGIFSEFTIMWARTSIISPFLNKLGITGNARTRILKNFNVLAEIKNIKNPTFTFAHLVIPHPPYLFGRNGEDVSDSKMEFDGYVWKQKDRYLDQLLFVNTKVLDLINIILCDKSYRPVIIIQADHGSASSFDFITDENTWEDATTVMIKERMSILNAYYFPDKKYGKLYKNITPVNSFRILFNELFNIYYSILKDKNYWSPYKKPFNFREITDELNQ